MCFNEMGEALENGEKLVVVNYVATKYEKLEVKENTYYYTQIGSVILLIRYDREYRFRSAGEEDIKGDALAQLLNGNASVVYNTNTRDMTVMLYFG